MTPLGLPPVTAGFDTVGKGGKGANAFDTLAIVGLLLLLLATAIAVAVAMQQLRSIAHTEAQARAQRVADSLAGRIGRALYLGVPLVELVGVPALFDQRMQQVPGLAGLALADASGQLLWLQQPGQLATERAPLPAGIGQALPAGLQVTAAVRLKDSEPARSAQTAQTAQTAQSTESAQVILVWQDLDAGSLLGKSLLPLIAWPLAMAVLAALALQRSLRRGRMQRDAVLSGAMNHVLAGDFSHPLPALRRHEFDSRPAWLGDRLRLVNEQQLRITRLHQSLRQTEPDAVRRAALDAALAHAMENQQFRDTGIQASIQARDKTAHDTAPDWGRAAMRCAAGLGLVFGLLLPLLMAFAPGLLPSQSTGIEAALLLSIAGNTVWLGWIFMRTRAEPRFNCVA